MWWIFVILMAASTSAQIPEPPPTIHRFAVAEGGTLEEWDPNNGILPIVCNNDECGATVNGTVYWADGNTVYCDTCAWVGPDSEAIRRTHNVMEDPTLEVTIRFERCGKVYPIQALTIKNMDCPIVIGRGDSSYVGNYEVGTYGVGTHLIVISNSRISRRHCEIKWDDENREFYVKEQGSRLGTFADYPNPRPEDELSYYRRDGLYCIGNADCYNLGDPVARKRMRKYRSYIGGSSRIFLGATRDECASNNMMVVVSVKFEKITGISHYERPDVNNNCTIIRDGTIVAGRMARKIALTPPKFITTPTSITLHWEYVHGELYMVQLFNMDQFGINARYAKWCLNRLNAASEDDLLLLGHPSSMELIASSMTFVDLEEFRYYYFRVFSTNARTAESRSSGFFAVRTSLAPGREEEMVGYFNAIIDTLTWYDLGAV